MRDPVQYTMAPGKATAKQRGNEETGERYLIGSAELDMPMRQLRFAGVPVDVQPKVFDLLAYLVRHRDRVVSKDELFDKVWPSVVVSDASLSQTIKRARDLFRDQGIDQEIIRTVARRGYQFDHEVRNAESGFEESSNSSPLLPRNAIAVLPFTNLTPDADFGYFSDGLTETLINKLATVRGLTVIARTSAYDASQDNRVPAAIGEALGAAYLFQGSVQRDGDTLRISARLIHSVDSAQLWSHQFNRLMDDVFGVQDAIAESVVRELALTLDLDLDAPRTTGIAETLETAQAYRLTLRGTQERRGGTRRAVQQAEGLFREALAVAPDFSPALVGLSEAVRWQGSTGSRPRDDAFREALTLIDQALRLDPEDGLAHLQRAELQHRHFWDFEGARHSYERALELMPGSGDLYSAYSRFLAKAGDASSAVNSAREAASMDPRSQNVQTNLSLRLIKANLLDDARRAIETLRVLNKDSADLPWLEANWHSRNGKHREALQWITLEELDHLRLSLSAISLHHLGRTAQGEQTLAELIDKDAEGAAFQIATVYARWGDPDQAFAWLDRALQSGDPGLIELYSSLDLESLYDDPRFLLLAERIGLPSSTELNAPR